MSDAILLELQRLHARLDEIFAVVAGRQPASMSQDDFARFAHEMRSLVLDARNEAERRSQQLELMLAGRYLTSAWKAKFQAEHPDVDLPKALAAFDEWLVRKRERLHYSALSSPTQLFLRFMKAPEES